MPDLENTIITAMQQLADEQGHFGITGDGNGDDEISLEKKFQKKLKKYIVNLLPKKERWNWYREIGFGTRKLTNKEKIEIDIAGCSPEGEVVAIELKYVTTNTNNNNSRPSDVSSFPYDLVKDCLIIEIAIRETSCFSSGYVIALTNWDQFWGGGEEQTPTCWATDFREIIAHEDVLLERGVLHTSGIEPEATIFGRPAGKRQPRPHISLGYKWSGTWFDYNIQNYEGNAFRYLLLKPQLDGDPDYSHEKNANDTIPFLTKKARKAFVKKQKEIDKKRQI
jgi:hypothetical protein